MANDESEGRQHVVSFFIDSALDKVVKEIGEKDYIPTSYLKIGNRLPFHYVRKRGFVEWWKDRANPGADALIRVSRQSSDCVNQKVHVTVEFYPEFEGAVRKHFSSLEKATEVSGVEYRCVTPKSEKRCATAP